MCLVNIYFSLSVPQLRGQKVPKPTDSLKERGAFKAYKAPNPSRAVSEKKQGRKNRVEGTGESHNYRGNDWRVGGLADRGYKCNVEFNCMTPLKIPLLRATKDREKTFR